MIVNQRDFPRNRLLGGELHDIALHNRYKVISHSSGFERTDAYLMRGTKNFRLSNILKRSTSNGLGMWFIFNFRRYYLNSIINLVKIKKIKWWKLWIYFGRPSFTWEGRRLSIKVSSEIQPRSHEWDKLLMFQCRYEKWLRALKDHEPGSRKIYRGKPH